MIPILAALLGSGAAAGAAGGAGSALSSIAGAGGAASMLGALGGQAPAGSASVPAASGQTPGTSPEFDPGLMYTQIQHPNISYPTMLPWK